MNVKSCIPLREYVTLLIAFKEKKRATGESTWWLLSWFQINGEGNPRGIQTQDVSLHSHHMPPHVN